MKNFNILTEIPEILKEESQLPKFLTIKEFVVATKISRQTISRKLKLGEIPYSRIGKRILIPSSFLVSLEKAAWSIIDQKGEFYEK
jgi:excisionase family DNA binding protein